MARLSKTRVRGLFIQFCFVSGLAFVLRKEIPWSHATYTIYRLMRGHTSTICATYFHYQSNITLTLRRPANRRACVFDMSSSFRCII